MTSGFYRRVISMKFSPDPIVAAVIDKSLFAQVLQFIISTEDS